MAKKSWIKRNSCVGEAHPNPRPRCKCGAILWETTCILGDKCPIRKVKEGKVTKDEAFQQYQEALEKIDKQVHEAKEDARAVLREQLKALRDLSHRE